MDINPSLQILGCYVKSCYVDKGIRQKSTKRVNSLIVCSAICLGHPTVTPWDSEKRLHVYTSATTMARHEWRVDKSSDKTRKNRMHVKTLSARRHNNIFRV